jgi:arylsulfatase A-like enzyme
VYPTICDVLGISAPDHLRGSSLRPALASAEATIREEVYAEVNFHAARDPMRMVRTDRYLYVRHFAEEATRPLANIDDGPSKTAMLEAGLLPEPVIPEGLYDLWDDPVARHNRIDDPALAEPKRDLAGRLERWMSETDDPLLDGPLRRAPEARIQHHACVSPGDTAYETGEYPT